MFEDILPMCSDDLNCPTNGYWTSSFVVGSDVQPESYDLNSKGKIQQMNLKASPVASDGSDSRAWCVGDVGRVGRGGVDYAGGVGVRPVITISKS